MDPGGDKPGVNLPAISKRITQNLISMLLHHRKGRGKKPCLLGFKHLVFFLSKHLSQIQISGLMLHNFIF